jgi:hypothetical protein
VPRREVFDLRHVRPDALATELQRFLRARRWSTNTMTPLDSPLRREILVDDTRYTLLLTGEGLRLTQKGHRKGIELSWRDLVSGDAAVATALRASLS